MVGAIAGDIIGSVYEGFPIKTKGFPLFSPGCRFTDDTVLTVAVADRLLNGGDYVDLFHHYFHLYPHAGYGGSFTQWAVQRRREPYNSWGNGSAMRVSPVGFLVDGREQVLEEAERSAEVTHNHPEGVRGAQATALAVHLARRKAGKEEIRREVERQCGYDLGFSLEEIRPHYHFDISCQGSVPQSIVAFLESESYEDTVRNAVSLGGDTDTMAAIAGGIAQAYYGMPPEIEEQAMAHLDERLARVVLQAKEAYSSDEPFD